MAIYQIEFKFSFYGIEDESEDSVEYVFDAEVVNIDADSCEDAEEKLYELYDDEGARFMSDDAIETFSRMEGYEEDQITVRSVMHVEGEMPTNNVIMIVYPDGTDEYPYSKDGKYVTYYATIWDEEKYNTDDDYEPLEVPVYENGLYDV